MGQDHIPDCGGVGLKILLEQLRSTDPANRDSAISVITSAPNPSIAVPLLVDATHSIYRDVRLSAVSALRQIAPELQGVLPSLADERDKCDRQTAILLSAWCGSSAHVRAVLGDTLQDYCSIVLEAEAKPACCLTIRLRGCRYIAGPYRWKNCDLHFVRSQYQYRDLPPHAGTYFLWDHNAGFIAFGTSLMADEEEIAPTNGLPK